MKRIALLLCLVLPVAASLCAQGRRGGASRGSRTPAPNKGSGIDEPLANLAGTLKAIDRKTMIVEDADANTLEFRFTKKTQYFDHSTKTEKAIEPSALKNGDTVSVEARRDLDGSLEAVNVRLERHKE